MTGFLTIGTLEENPRLFEAFEFLIGEREIPPGRDKREFLRECRAVVREATDQARKRQKDADQHLSQPLPEMPNSARQASGSDVQSALTIEHRDKREMSQTELVAVLP